MLRREIARTGLQGMPGSMRDRAKTTWNIIKNGKIYGGVPMARPKKQKELTQEERAANLEIARSIYRQKQDDKKRKRRKTK